VPLNGMQTGTSNVVTFRKGVFSRRLTPQVAGYAIARIMGLLEDLLARSRDGNL
jgi:hypothetical protein